MRGNWDSSMWGNFGIKIWEVIWDNNRRGNWDNSMWGTFGIIIREVTFR